jgi:uncharacterized protein YkwD
VKGFLSRLFIPQPSNNHRALILQPTFLGIFIAVYLLNQSFIRSFSALKPGVLGYSSEITAKKVLDQTNDQRIKLGIKPLSYNSVLSQSAEAKAKDMFASNYWAHNSPLGKTPWDFFKNAGYQYSVAGENLAKDFYDTEGLFKAWMDSPTHRANIVNGKYQEIGIGVVNGVLNGLKTTLVVQHFGTPLSGQVLASTPPPEEISVPNTNLAKVSAPINPLLISKVLGITLFLIIISVLVVDSYITLKNRTNRLTGSSASHIGFLAIILILLLFSQQGTIF